MQQIKYLMTLSYGLILGCLVAPLCAMEDNKLPYYPGKIELTARLPKKEKNAIYIAARDAGKCEEFIDIKIVKKAELIKENNSTEDASYFFNPGFIPFKLLLDQGKTVCTTIQAGKTINPRTNNLDFTWVFSNDNTFIPKQRVDGANKKYNLKKKRFDKATCCCIPVVIKFISQKQNSTNDTNFALEIEDHIKEFGNSSCLSQNVPENPQEWRARVIKKAQMEGFMKINQEKFTLVHGPESIVNEPNRKRLYSAREENPASIVGVIRDRQIGLGGCPKAKRSRLTYTPVNNAETSAESADTDKA